MAAAQTTFDIKTHSTVNQGLAKHFNSSAKDGLRMQIEKREMTQRSHWKLLASHFVYDLNRKEWGNGATPFWLKYTFDLWVDIVIHLV